MFTVYKMQFEGESDIPCNINCSPFDMKYWNEYKNVYNECFHEMRATLGIKPYDYLSNKVQIAEKASSIFLLIINGEFIGSVACYGNEIDDLIVSPKYQHQGYGRQLLLWAIRNIRSKSSSPITLHVAQWNQKAVGLYKSMGFTVIETEVIEQSVSI